MTFLDLARRAFPSWDLEGEQLKRAAEALEYGYCEALRSCSWRLGGTQYIGEGRQTMKLDDVIARVRNTGAVL